MSNNTKDKLCTFSSKEIDILKELSNRYGYSENCIVRIAIRLLGNLRGVNEGTEKMYIQKSDGTMIQIVPII